jgi:hypothetical protein
MDRLIFYRKKQMKTIIKSLTVFVVGLNVIGCSSMGNAPESASNEEFRANFEKSSPQEQINVIQASPMPAADKEKKIAEIRAKHNMTEETPANKGGQPEIPGR